MAIPYYLGTTESKERTQCFENYNKQQMRNFHFGSRSTNTHGNNKASEAPFQTSSLKAKTLSNKVSHLQSLMYKEENKAMLTATPNFNQVALYLGNVDHKIGNNKV